MRFFTVGYAGRSLEELLALLNAHQVTLLVDVRRFPRSRYAGFGRDALSAALARAGIRYAWLGEALGGFRGGYRRYMGTPEYQGGIRRLLGLPSAGNRAVMCKERQDSGCHRRFIAQSLRELGQDVEPL